MYGYVIVASWLVLIVIWVLGSLAAKPDAESSPRAVRLLWQIPLLALLIYVLRNPHADAFVLERTFFNVRPALGWVGALLTVTGVAFAIWARYKLGRNWGVHQKEDPVLVTSGPYAYVRHPLYASVILALLGSALTGSIVAVAYFVIGITYCLRRINQEERAMLNLFPGQYPSYQVCTKRLIPFVW